MADKFKREKTLTRSFSRIGLDENDLARLASIIVESPVLSQENFLITVRSADQEDRFSTSTPQFFLDQNLPKVLSEVNISSQRYNAPVSCRLDLSSGKNSRASLTVDGNEVTAVSGLFHELCRELEARKLIGGWWVKRFDSPLFFLLFGLLLSSTVYSIFNVSLNICKSTIPNFDGSTLHQTFVGIGWVCTLGTYTSSLFLIEWLKKIFPSVQFHGRIEDEGKRLRRHIFWIMSVVLIPIILNVLSTALISLLNK